MSALTSSLMSFTNFKGAISWVLAGRRDFLSRDLPEHHKQIPLGDLTANVPICCFAPYLEPELCWQEWSNLFLLRNSWYRAGNMTLMTAHYYTNSKVIQPFRDQSSLWVQMFSALAVAGKAVLIFGRKCQVLCFWNKCIGVSFVFNTAFAGPLCELTYYSLGMWARVPCYSS